MYKNNDRCVCVVCVCVCVREKIYHSNNGGGTSSFPGSIISEDPEDPENPENELLSIKLSRDTVWWYLLENMKVQTLVPLGKTKTQLKEFTNYC